MHSLPFHSLQERRRVSRRSTADMYPRFIAVAQTPAVLVLDEHIVRTPSPASIGSVNSMRSPVTTTAQDDESRTATIRSVPSSKGSESSLGSKYSAPTSPGLVSNASPSAMSGSQLGTSPSSVRLEESPHLTDTTKSFYTSATLKSPLTNDMPKSPFMNDTIKSFMMETPARWTTYNPNVRVVEPATPLDTSFLSDGETESRDGQWDSTVGKAGLGKTGRVINKLVSDNDALKRDLKIERLRAEEYKQAAKLIEDKMERMISDYEGRLLEANVTKALLARKERQVESLQATVELEKNKTQAAIERERGWKNELEKTQKDSTFQIEEATTHAQMMESQYNAISSHWKEQGEEVKKAVSKVKVDIDSLVEERKVDDSKIQTLRDLCDQQDSNIKELRREKEEIARKFEEYKQTQEDDLKDIKTNARAREVEQENILEEAREALDKLRWALNVKQNVQGAQ